MFSSTLRSSRRHFYRTRVNSTSKIPDPKPPTIQQIFKYSDANEHLGSTRVGLVLGYCNGQHDWFQNVNSKRWYYKLCPKSMANAHIPE